MPDPGDAFSDEVARLIAAIRPSLERHSPGVVTDALGWALVDLIADTRPRRVQLRRLARIATILADAVDDPEDTPDA